MLAECAHELLRPLQQGILEFDDVLELPVAKQPAACINGQPSTVFIAPAPDRVEALEHKTQWVDPGMAAGTGLLGGMLLQALADRHPLCLDLGVVSLDLRNGIRRRRWRITTRYR